MLHELPITNVRLHACAEDWEQMTPTARGRYCTQCELEVQDFTEAAAPELAWARITAAGGPLCGRFKTQQLAPTSRPGWQLRPRLRLFLAAVVLVLLQGFTAQQAWAQVKHSTPRSTPPPPPGGIHPPPSRPVKGRTFEGRPVYAFANQMPVYKDGGIEGMMAYIGKHLRYPYPCEQPKAGQGKVFVSFIIDRTGRVRQPVVTQRFTPACDAEALRLVSQLREFVPGRQSGAAVDVEYTVPITFSLR